MSVVAVTRGVVNIWVWLKSLQPCCSASATPTFCVTCRRFGALRLVRRPPDLPDLLLRPWSGDSRTCLWPRPIPSFPHRFPHRQFSRVTEIEGVEWFAFSQWLRRCHNVCRSQWWQAGIESNNYYIATYRVYIQKKFRTGSPFMWFYKSWPPPENSTGGTSILKYYLPRRFRPKADAPIQGHIHQSSPVQEPWP